MSYGTSASEAYHQVGNYVAILGANRLCCQPVR